MRGLAFASLICGAAVACGSSNKAKTVDGATDSGGSNTPDASGSGSGSGTPTNVVVTFTNPPATAADFVFVVGYQDGSGAWQDAPAPTGGGVFTLPIYSASYGVAYTCISNPDAGSGGSANGPDRDVFVGFFTVAEQATLSVTLPAQCTDPVTLSKLTGAIQNVPIDEGGTFQVLAAASTGVVQTTAGGTDYTLNVAPGNYDVYLVHLAAGTPQQPATGVPDKILVQRGVTVNTTPTTQNLDFANANAPQTFAVAITAGNTTEIENHTDISSNNTLNATLIDQVANGSAGTAFDPLELAAHDAMATDLYTERVTLTDNGTGGALASTTFTNTPSAYTFTAPAAFGGVLTSVPTDSPYPELQLTWDAYTSAIGYLAVTQQGCVGNGATCVTWSMATAAGYVGASPTMQMPDLTALTGWDTRLQFVAGTAIAGRIDAETSTAGAGDFANPNQPASGTVRTNAFFNYEVTP